MASTKKKNDSQNQENPDNSTTTQTDTTQQQKTATTGYRFSGESKGYQAFKPSEWTVPKEIPFSEFVITETDLRVKTATFSSPYHIDLTNGRACIWIQRKYGENFGGVILSCEYDGTTGMYNYSCQDWNRLLTNKVYVILAGDTKVYDIIKKLLIKCNISTDGLKSIDSYDYIIEEVPLDDDPNETLGSSTGGNFQANSNTGNNTNNSNSSSDNKKSSKSKKKTSSELSAKQRKELEKAEHNPFYKKPSGLYDKITARDFILALVMKAGVSIDIHMDENGVLHFDKYEKDTYRKARWFFVDTDIYEPRLKLDITDIITQVAVKHTDPLDANATLYTSEKLLGVNLATFFGVMGTVIDNPTKASGGGVSASNGDTITCTGKPSSACCPRAYGGKRPPYKDVTRTYRNVCGMCNRSGTLKDTPKGGRSHIPEGEITCGVGASNAGYDGSKMCDADFCICCGWEKMSRCGGRLQPVGASGTAASTTNTSSSSNTTSGSSAQSNSSNTSSNGTSANATDTSVANTNTAGTQVAVEDYTKNKMAARIAFSETIRKWYTFSVKVPGEYDLLHTNSFCMFMVDEKFATKNMSKIGKKLDGKFTRYMGYEKNRFYIEEVVVRASPRSGLSTELKLNPFASDYSTFAKTQLQAEEALASALGGGGTGNANGTDCNEDHGRTFKISTTGTNPTQKNLAVIGNSSANYAQIAAQANGNPATALKLMKQRWKYLRYSDNAYGSQYCPQKMFAMSTARGNCADSAWLMKCIFDCMGLPNYIRHVPQHYMNMVQWNGKWYSADLCYWKGSNNDLSKM